MLTTYPLPQYITTLENAEQPQTNWWRRIETALPNAVIPRRAYDSTTSTPPSAHVQPAEGNNEVPVEWLAASEELLAAIWDNDEDAIYDTM